MFAERFDALMNIAEVSNSILGKYVNMNSSYIGRLRSGARALPKKHDYLRAMCRYFVNHIKKDYQLNALQKLTGFGAAALNSPELMASCLEHWLEEKEQDTSVATGRLISGFSHLASKPASFPEKKDIGEVPQKYVDYLYGNAGKRRAVKQFFLMILKEDKAQTLLLFSDENMSWLYEDADFVSVWTELFTQVLLRGNRVRVVHTVSRDMNEMLEAVTKWIPIYMTGMVESYCYPRLRDGLFQHTFFIAPNTAAVISSSVQQNTEGMLNLFITNQAALDALTLEYERYFSLCRPLMKIFKSAYKDEFHKAVDTLTFAEGAACLCCAAPPLFAMPEKLVYELAAQTENEAVAVLWKKSYDLFKQQIKHQSMSLILLDPKVAKPEQRIIYPELRDMFELGGLPYSDKQYRLHIDHLLKLEKKHENLKVYFKTDVSADMLIYVKDDAGVIMAKSDKPVTVFVINDRNMTNAFWDYLTKL